MDRIQSRDYPELAERLNQLAENIEALQFLGGRNLRSTSGPKGFTIDGNPSVEETSEESPVVQRFKILAFSATYISAVKTDGFNDDETTVFRIALPYDLRDGTQTNSNTNPTRNVTISGVTGTEEITPAYAVNGQIVAALVTGNTGVFVPIGGENVELEWEDLNVAGRTWQFPQRVVRVCVNGNTRSLIIRGSFPV